MHGKSSRVRHPGQPGRIPFRPRLEPLEERQLLSTSVLTYHNDLMRSGANLTETTLTHDTVNAATFGKLFSYPVDGYVYAQPLFWAAARPGDRDLVIAATERNGVYSP